MENLEHRVNTGCLRHNMMARFFTSTSKAARTATQLARKCRVHKCLTSVADSCEDGGMFGLLLRLVQLSVCLPTV